MMLDMRTIVFGYVLTDIACLVVMVLLWRQTGRRFAGTGFLVFDFACQLAALFLVVLRGSIPDWMSMVLANTLSMTGALLGYMGLLRFVGKKSRQIHNYVLLAFFVIVQAYFALVQPTLAVRNLNISLVLFIICFQCAWLLLYVIQPGMRRLTRVVGMIFAAFCAVSIVRIADFFIGSHSTENYLQAGIFEQLILVSYQMLFILLTYSLVLMLNKRLLSDITTQEEKFSKAFHSSPYAVTITRMSDGQIIEVNEGFFRITGYQPTDIRGNTSLGLNLWDRAEDRASVVSELADKGKVAQREFQFRKKSGEIITGVLSAETFVIDNEVFIVSSINDITERKQTEESLKTSERKYRNLFNNAIEGIFQSSAEGGYISINPAFARIGGYDSPEEMLNSVIDIQKEMYVHPEDRARLLELCNQQDIVNNFEVEIRRRDNEIRWISINVKPVRNQSGKIILLEGTIVDITERKSAEEEVNKLNRQLEQRVAQRTSELHDTQLALLNLVDDLNRSAADIFTTNQSLEAVNKELAAFSYSVSHDLRAPLRSIDGFSLALLEDCQEKLDAAGKSYLARIRQATQHMSRLIDDMLNLAWVNQSAFYLEKVDLSMLLQQLAADIGQQHPARSVDMIIAANVVSHCDKRLIQIALTNLLDNAWKFTGKVQQPKIEFGSMIAEGKTVLFLRDNGVGFDMKYVDKLFGTFQRLHRADEFPGTGIGLATVQRIIHRHGGRIWAEGEVGKGAVFYFTLP